MKNLFFTAIVLLGTQVSFAQLEKNVGDYNSLKVYDKIPTELIKSSTNKVVITGAGEQDVEVINKNGDLKIRMKTFNLLQGDKVNLKVYFKELTDIQASQGASIYSNDKIKTTSLNIISNEGSSVKVDVNTDRLEVKSNSGGEAIVNGSTTMLIVNANSGGKFYGKTLKAKNATLTTNAGGEIEATVSETVESRTRAGGTIDVYGSPKVKNDKKFAGGKITYK
jgi:hypothetical protein